MSNIIAIFGKRGSGKTTLSRELMYRYGGRVVFLSPVERVKSDYIGWTNEEIYEQMANLRHGEILYIPRADIEAFEIVCLTAMAKGDYTLVIDEMDRYNKAEELNDLIHYSRHCRINLICNTRRYTHMPRLLTSQADYLMIFQTNEPRDLAYFKEYADLQDIHVIQTLSQYCYYIHPTGEIKQTKVLDF